MSHHTITDNLFALGTPVSPKALPALKLTIVKYYQRIYYCADIDDPSQKHLAFFENEINPL